MLVLNPAIFRANDIRGIAGRDLSPEFAECLGLAYARYLGDRRPAAGRAKLTVSVGRDCRLTGESYADALVRGLLAGGLDVIRLGVCPTPLAYFSVFHLNLDGAIMVTASHNTADYNGFKICAGRDTLLGEQIQAVRELMHELMTNGQGRSAPLPGSMTDRDVVPAYLDHLTRSARPLRPMKIVLDAGNGTAGSVAPELFRRLGAEVVPLYCEPDGRFPNHHPDPTVPANLADLASTVVRHGADFGVGFDGDSDRIGLVDERGRIVFGDELLILFSRDILRAQPGATIVSEVKASHRLYQDIAARGGKAIMWKAGHAAIKSKMKETGAALAGELSGHIFFADRYFGFDDALYAALRFYEIASAHPGAASSLLSDLPASFATPEIRIDCVEELKFMLATEARRLIVEKGHSTIDLDGVRVDFGDGWGLLRASNTQAALVMRFEASSRKRLLEIGQLMEETLVQAVRTIGHPPIRFCRDF